MSGQIFIVTLRQPKNKNDPRDDPFWEFGSFGCTGCHRAHLLHPRKHHIVDGDRLAFIQGGHRGSRLMLLTPPIKRIDYGGGSSKGRVELRWNSTKKPFRYDRAPSLFESPSPGSPGLFPQLAAYITETNRTTPDAKFSSRFRSRTFALEPELARELQAGFNAAVGAATPSVFITHYTDALPWCDCPRSPRDRRSDYKRLQMELKKSTVSSNPRPRMTSCRP
jgi:hypothetical protein